MARDADSVEAREQRLSEELAWARQYGSEQTLADAQRRYEQFLDQYDATEW